MRDGVKPNPKKDKDARRKSRPGWHPIKATAKVITVDVKSPNNGKTYKKKMLAKI